MNSSFFKKIFGFSQETKSHKYKNDTELLVKNRLRKSLGLPEIGHGRKAGPVGNLFIAALVSLMVLLPVAHVFAAAYITLDSFSGNPTTLHVSGGGWSSGETISLYLNSVSGTPAATATVGIDSFFGPTNLVIPPNTPQGALPIIAIGSQNGLRADNSYYVVHFAANLTAESSPNTPGSTVHVSGSGYAPGETVQFLINGTVGGQAVADSSGAFTNASYVIPNLPTGTYQLHGIGQSSGADGVDYFYIGGFYPSAFPSTYYVLPGQQLSFSGSGFAAGETIDVISLPDTSPTTSFTADATGAFTNAGTITILLNAIGGVHSYRLHGHATGGNVDLMVTVGAFNASVSPSAYFLRAGDVLTFSGSGYAPNETVKVFVDGSASPSATFTAGTDGSFSDAGAVIIPFDFAGATHTFTVTGTSSHSGGSVSIGVAGYYPGITPSSYYVTPGQTFTVSGSGFAAGENVSVSLNGGAPITTHASSSGEFNAVGPFTAPITGTVLHMLATGVSSGVTASVDVSLGSLSPMVSPDAYYVHAGGTVSFSGSGFAPGENVSIARNGSSLKTVSTDAAGSFTNASVITDFGMDRTESYTFTGASSGAIATVSITIAAVHPVVSADNYYVTSGTTVRITGTNFSPNEGVTVTVGSATASGTADSSGTASSVPVTIPFSVAGTTIQAIMTGNSSHASGFTTITLAPFYPGVIPSTWYTAPGTKVDFTGSGFAAGEVVTVTLNGNNVGSATTTAEGAFDLSNITIPFISTSAHFVFTGNLSNAPTSVDIGLSGFSPQISPSTWYAAPGSKINFTGSGFAPGETVSINFNGTLASSTTDGLGGFTSGDFTVPFTGSIHVSFASSVTHITQSFDIGVAALSPSIWFSTYYDQGGKPLTVYGGGFAGNETVHLTFAGTALGDIATDAGGNFTFITTVPFAAAGDKIITAHGESSGVNSSAKFTEPPVYVNIQLGSYAGAAGSNITFIGSGYLPGESVNVTTDRTGSTVVYTFNADSNGNFNDSGFSIPITFAGGPLTLTVSGTHSFTSSNIVYYITGQ